MIIVNTPSSGRTIKSCSLPRKDNGRHSAAIKFCHRLAQNGVRLVGGRRFGHQIIDSSVVVNRIDVVGRHEGVDRDRVFVGLSLFYLIAVDDGRNGLFRIRMPVMISSFGTSP